MKGTRKAMGGGVDALFNNSRVLERLDNVDKSAMQIHIVSLNRIYPNADQPRKRFVLESISELSQSIAQHGILQPLVVKPSSEIVGSYTIIAGERRYRAAKEAGLKEIPVIIHDIGTKEAFVLALIENIQREALNSLEEAQALDVLKEDFGFTQEELARTLGKSRSTIANLLRLLQLSAQCKQALESDAISLGHAKVLLGVSEEIQDKIIGKVVEDNLSVRETEELIKEVKSSPLQEVMQDNVVEHVSPYEGRIQEIADRLSQRYETKIRIKNKGEKGKIEISFSSWEMLDSLLMLLEKE